VRHFPEAESKFLQNSSDLVLSVETAAGVVG